MTLRELRLQKNLTQAELASMIGVDSAHISYLETGNRKPSYETLIKLASVLNVSERDFYSFMRSFSSNEPQIQ